VAGCFIEKIRYLMTYCKIRKKWQILPPRTKRCQMAWK
jgi:hypothetical protein